MIVDGAFKLATRYQARGFNGCQYPPSGSPHLRLRIVNLDQYLKNIATRTGSSKITTGNRWQLVAGTSITASLNIEKSLALMALVQYIQK